MKRMDDFRAPAPPGDVRADGKTPGQDEKSVPLYVQALPVTEKLHGENSLERAAALEKLSLAYSGLGDCQSALPLMERAWALRCDLQGRYAPDTLRLCGQVCDLWDRLSE